MSITAIHGRAVVGQYGIFSLKSNVVAHMLLPDIAVFVCVYMSLLRLRIYIYMIYVPTTQLSLMPSICDLFLLLSIPMHTAAKPARGRALDLVVAHEAMRLLTAPGAGVACAFITCQNIFLSFPLHFSSFKFRASNTFMKWALPYLWGVGGID